MRPDDCSHSPEHITYGANGVATAVGSERLATYGGSVGQPLAVYDGGNGETAMPLAPYGSGFLQSVLNIGSKIATSSATKVAQKNS